MKAAVFHAPGQAITIEEVPIPQPAPGEILMRVARCGICSSDLQMTSGKGIAFPGGSVLGHEYAGEVVELGAGVREFRVGDRITALPLSGCGACAECRDELPLLCAQMRPMMGGFGEYNLVRHEHAVRLPASLTMAHGALVEPLASALHGARMANIRAGARVAVLGVGPIGLGAIFWSRHLGAGPICAVARTRRQAPLAHSMGASAFLCQDDLLPQALSAALGGAPEILLECAGVPGLLAQAVDLAGPRARIVVLGQCGTADSLVPAAAGLKALSISFSAAYSAGDFRYVVDLLDRGALEPRSMITATIGLDQLPLEFERLRAAGNACKVLIDPSLGSA